LIPRPFPYQVSLSYQGRNSLQGYISPNNENELHKAKNNFCIEQPLNEEFWIKFKEYIKTTHREKSVICRLSYAKKYYHILLEDNAQDILSLSDQKRLQVMKSLVGKRYLFTNPTILFEHSNLLYFDWIKSRRGM
jgi:hypothetical protein